MKVIYGIGPAIDSAQQTVVAIGVFDSVHKGHQKVIRAAVSIARQKKCPAIVITFHPHPVSVLRPKDFSAYVMPLAHRLKLIESYGADVCYVIPFNKHFSLTSPENFVRNIIWQRLRACQIVVGEDFHFGHNREGSCTFLERQGKILGFVLKRIPTMTLGGIPVKTRSIKKMVAKGDLRRLKSFLGRPYSISSTVIKGDRRGRKLGFPTANLARENVVTLPYGIYLVRVHLPSGNKKNGLLYIGSRPTIKVKRDPISWEVYILDFQGSLYGQLLEVEVLERLRRDQFFSDEISLANQIRLDIVKARQFFLRSNLV